MIEYIREIDATKWNGSQKNNIEQYKNVPGVWILLGKKKGDTHLVCLQVGQTKKDISSEIKTNIYYLCDNSSEHPAQKKYVNQFGEGKFDYDVPISRQEFLYKEIAKNYDNLTFICVAHGKELENQDSLLRTIEKYVAFKTLCRYWANGGPYNEKAPEEVERIKKECTDSCAELFEKIKKDYPEKKADFLKEFLDKLIDGEFDYLISEK